MKDPTTIAPAMPAAMTRKIMIGRYSRNINVIDRHPVRERTPSARPPAPQKRRHYRAAIASKKGQNEPISAAKFAWLESESQYRKMAGATGTEHAATGMESR